MPKKVTVGPRPSPEPPVGNSNDSLSGALTVAEFCRSYRVGKTFVYAEIKAGRLRAIKVGTGTRILRADAERWAESLPALVTAMVQPPKPRRLQRDQKGAGRGA